MDYRDNRQRWAESHQVVHFYAGQWCTFTPALTAGTRNNKRLREYVREHLADIEYRTKACADKAAAKAEERKMRDNNHYCF